MRAANFADHLTRGRKGRRGEGLGSFGSKVGLVAHAFTNSAASASPAAD
jgi:hypothetical protein